MTKTLTKPTLTPLHLQTITIFGDYGTGKTSLALGNPKALYLDLEDGKPDAFREAPDFPVERTWVKFSEAIKESWDGDKRFDGHTLVIDPVTELWMLFERYYLAKIGAKEWPRDDYGRTLKAGRMEFEEVFNMLLMLRTKGRMGTVLIAHEDIEEIETETRTIRSGRPKVADKHVKSLVGAKPQMVLRTFLADEHPRTLAPFAETQYLVMAKPLTAQDKVKDRTGRLPQFVKANWQSLETAYNLEPASAESA